MNEYIITVEVISEHGDRGLAWFPVEVEGPLNGGKLQHALKMWEEKKQLKSAIPIMIWKVE